MSVALLNGVTLEKAQASELSCIENMMQFYNYELSQWYPIDFSAAGAYSIQSKAEYWATAGVAPYLIKANGDLAGFAVVDSEVIDAGYAHNLGYFFVARRYRKQGIGLATFSTLLKLFPGAWEVYYLAKNKSAAQFWPSAFKKAGIVGLNISNELIHDEASVLCRFNTANAA